MSSSTNRHTNGTHRNGTAVLDDKRSRLTNAQCIDDRREAAVAASNSPTTSAEALGRTALWYARLGYGVFPCRPGSKEPATKRGFKDATSDSRCIPGRFRHGHNVGLIAPENVLVIDVDVSKDARMLLAQRLADTRQRLKGLEATFPEVAEAPLHATPSGGYHLFLRLPEGAPRLITGAWPRGAHVSYGELRGLGRAYVVAPPSATPEGMYRVIRRLTPVDALPIASPQLLNYLHPQERPRKRPRKAAVGAIGHERFAAQITHVRSARVGTRNNTLNRSAFMAGVLVAAGELDEETVEADLLAAAVAVGLPEREALATIASGFRAGKREGGG